MSVDVVSLTLGLVEDAWQLNERFATELSSTALPGFERLVLMCSSALAAVHRGRLVGFVLALDQRADYESLNYLWFRSRYERFYYVDRIAILPEWHGHGLGKRLYHQVAIEALAHGHTSLCCEFNVAPANHASALFHKRMGFQAVGTRAYANSSRTVSMQLLDLRRLTLASASPPRTRP